MNARLTRNAIRKECNSNNPQQKGDTVRKEFFQSELKFISRITHHGATAKARTKLADFVVIRAT